MLDTDTKRRIDTARDILVGKVPDPKSQVEQITIALIYKFMDDMDAEAEEFGGKRKFFAGDFSRYGWTKLMRSGLGGHETLNLYAEAITKMPENPGIPLLFRDIFKNAYLPYRDPETLKSFLKIIDEFNYDHSERLGDAFEYLLSVLGSQGDAGQFRTPRHIIDFIVDIIDPKKGETILDPACGTAGFLISSYKHMLAKNVDAQGHSTLTPDEKGRIAKNFKGYDISPDMVRLSLVNLYLHGFTNPHIYEYDTLTSEERWNEFADVIFANPPFMSPKGGIKPHKRFSIQAKRSEVLFVDYIAEHLTPTGRAGIIVPEGIIFQSQGAYKELRKMLVENSLVAVISLPAGVFNPYSGVKTSILILDKSLAKQSNTITFFKIENDGFGLGAQRRANAGEQLTQVKSELDEYLQGLHSHQNMDALQPMLGLIVGKEKIAMNEDYNLSGERYREGITRNSTFPHNYRPHISIDPDWPMVALGDLATFIQGTQVPVEEQRTDFIVGYVRFIRIVDYTQESNDVRYIKNCEGVPIASDNDLIMVRYGATAGYIGKGIKGVFANNLFRINYDADKILGDFLFYFFKDIQFQEFVKNNVMQAAMPALSHSIMKEVLIPLPSLTTQQAIVAEIEAEQKLVVANRELIERFEKKIQATLARVWGEVDTGS